MRVVLDTNIFIAALISNKGTPHRVYRAWLEGKFTLVTSTWQVEEFRRVSRYERVRPYIVPAEAGEIINGLRKRAIVLEALPKLELSPDPDDNFVLAMALKGEADYLVTGDKHDLLMVADVPNLNIIKVRTFSQEVLKIPSDND